MKQNLFTLFVSLAIIVAMIAALAVMMSGCEFHSYEYPHPEEVVYVDPGPTPYVVSTVVVENVCYPENYYEPFYSTPNWCEDYGVGLGYCCSWASGTSFGSGCEEEWCWWDDMCMWELVGETCYFAEVW